MDSHPCARKKRMDGAPGLEIHQLVRIFQARVDPCLLFMIPRPCGAKINKCRVLRDVIPPTPPGPEGSNGNGLVRAQWVTRRFLRFGRIDLIEIRAKSKRRFFDFAALRSG